MGTLVNLKQLKKETVSLKIGQEKLPECKCRDKKEQNISRTEQPRSVRQF